MDGFRPLSGSSAASPHSTRFPDSKHGSDPAPKRPKNKIPSTLTLLYVFGTLGSMVVLALAIEVALVLSRKYGGFPLGKRAERVQWLSGFVPTLAIGPLVWIWKRTDKDLKKMQPYVVLSQGPVPAKQSILMDLEHANIFRAVNTSWKNGYFLIIASTAIISFNVLLHPLAGSFFLVRQSKTMHPTDTFARSTATLGLNPSYIDITSFVAAAGFADAAAFHNLSDPPFVHGSWAVAEFKFPLDVTKNSTIAVRTTGVQTNVTCSASGTLSLTPPTASAPLNYTLTASLPERGPDCKATQSIDVTVASSQYGAHPVAGCTDFAPSRDDPFAPVVFWYFNAPPNGAAVASAVFCAPVIGVYAVEAVADGATGLIVSVKTTDELDRNGNNVTGGSFAGKSFNGISFSSVPDFNLTDPFVRARALAVQSGLPGAIFRFAADQEQGGGLNVVFSNATGFLGLTRKIYTQYMSIVALSNYFVPAEASVEAKVTLWPTRLWINPPVAHTLAALLLAVAIAGAAIHFIHTRQRRRLYLATSPGSMAHYMSILSDPQLVAATLRNDSAAETSVRPLDTKKSIRQKLGDMQFVLDPSTGGVVPVYSGSRRTSRVVELETRRASAVSAHSARSALHEIEDPNKALLGPEFKVEPYGRPLSHGDSEHRESWTAEPDRRRASAASATSSMSGYGYGVGYEMEDPSKALLGADLTAERYRDPFDHKSPV